MDKQNVILKTHELEVIGQGPMISEPCQIGEWWVMPAGQYTGTIPPEIYQKWDNFKALNIPVLGYLIADDMREVRIRQEQAAEQERQLMIVEQESQRRELERRQRQEAFNRTVKTVAETSGKVLVGVGMAVGAVAIGLATAAVGIIGAILRFDPILIAVLPDGRWICLGAWWD